MPTEPDDISFQKAAIIERALRRVFEEYRQDPDLECYTHLDALILNLERAAQAAIDLATHRCARDHLGVPGTSADAFRLLQSAGMLNRSTCTAMVAMTGFRNIAVHQYQDLDPEIIRQVATSDWRQLVDFCTALGLHIDP